MALYKEKTSNSARCFNLSFKGCVCFLMRYFVLFSWKSLPLIHAIPLGAIVSPLRRGTLLLHRLYGTSTLWWHKRSSQNPEEIMQPFTTESAPISIASCKVTCFPKKNCKSTKMQCMSSQDHFSCVRKMSHQGNFLGSWEEKCPLLSSLQQHIWCLATHFEKKGNLLEMDFYFPSPFRPPMVGAECIKRGRRVW